MRTSLFCLPLLLGAVASSSAQDGGIEIFAGETIFAEGTRYSLTHISKVNEGLLSGSTEVSDPLNQRFSEQRTVLGINHGIARDWSLSALVPYVRRTLESTAGDLTGSGLGDVSLIVKNRFHIKDWKRSAWHSAWIAGVELPTGETHAKEGGVRLAPGLQPGSGSVDLFLGCASTLDLDLWRYDAVALYKHNTEGSQDFEQGDKLSLSLSGKYRFLHEIYPGPSASATMGLKWAHTSHSEFGGVSSPNSGGEELLLKLKLGYHPRPDVDLGLSLDLPLYEDLGGTQLGLDNRIQVSLGLRF